MTYQRLSFGGPPAFACDASPMDLYRGSRRVSRSTKQENEVREFGCVLKLRSERMSSQFDEMVVA
jgi:hypothetical protein